jgi:hypothetical protein
VETITDSCTATDSFAPLDASAPVFGWTRVVQAITEPVFGGVICSPSGGSLAASLIASGVVGALVTVAIFASFVLKIISTSVKLFFCG